MPLPKSRSDTLPSARRKKLYRLPLEIDQIDRLALSWTLVHPINEQSPLHSISASDLEEADAEIIVMVNAVNDTFAQDIHSRTSYKYYDVVWDAKFERIYEAKGRYTEIRLDEIGMYKKVNNP